MTDFKIPLLVIKVIETFQKNNFEVYIVGGAVHDLILGLPVYDWDFTTNAKPQQIQTMFPDSFYDNKFGTIGVPAENLVKQFKLKSYDYQKENIRPHDVFDLTTYRTETKYTDRRHPDKVNWGKTLADDLQRRDFTINSLALQLTIRQPADQQLAINLIDPYHGQDDLKNRLIRCVGNPNQRFNEDALRMMRAIRIAAQLGFIIEENTLQAINVNAGLINHISSERVRDELIKIIKSLYPADGIRLLFSSGLLQYIIPELLVTRGIEQAGHHTKDVWHHSLDSLAGCPSPNPIVRLATLLHDIGKPKAFRIIDNKITFYGHEVIGANLVRGISQRLRFSKNDSDLLWLLVRFHMFAYDPKMTDKAIRRFIVRIGKENINNMISLRIGDRKGGGSKATSWRLRELQERIGKLMYTPLSINDLKVDGNDVMKVLNIKPGPKVGEILKKLFEEVMEDAAKNDKEYLIKEVKKLSN